MMRRSWGAIAGAICLTAVGCPADFTSAAPTDATELDDAAISADTESDASAGDTGDSAVPARDAPVADAFSPDTNESGVVDTGCSTDLQCDDKNACTVDRCGGGACSHAPLDLDGDGDGPKAAGCGGDCHDGNKDVFSKQSAFFSMPYTAMSGAATFDYNCDGLEERELTAKVSCSMSTCVPGWADAIPACGANGSWVTSCKTWMSSAGGNVCTEYYVSAKKQACR